MTTKGGTNQFHGTLFHFFRNDKLDAAGFFNNRSDLARPTRRKNQYGGNFGGPIKRDKLPTTAAEIMDRMNEITFNAGLLAEMRAIDFVKRLIAQGKLDASHYKDVLMHRIDGGELLEDYNAASKVSTNSQMIHKLRDLGRDATQKWLKQHVDQIGKEATLNIARDYLDDLRVPVKTANN